MSISLLVNGVRHDVDVATAIGAFVAARGPFLGELESIGRRRALEAPAVMGLYAEAAALLDRLLLHFVATFQAPATHQAPTRTA